MALRGRDKPPRRPCGSGGRAVAAAPLRACIAGIQASHSKAGADLMDDLARILQSPYLSGSMRAQVQEAFDGLWAHCSPRFARMPAMCARKARERLAGLIVLVTMSRSEESDRLTDLLVAHELVDIVCDTDFLTSDTRRLDFSRMLQPRST